MYWLAHGASLLRAAPEHVKPAQASQDMTERPKDPLDSAKDALSNVRNRGVTHSTDLTKTNKRRREEVDTDDEEGIDDRDALHVPVVDLPPDSCQPSDDGKMWTRIHNAPRKKLYVPAPCAEVPIHVFKPDRLTSIRRESPYPETLRLRDEWNNQHGDRELHYLWTGTTTFFVDLERLSDGYAPRDTNDEGDQHDSRELDDETMDTPDQPPSTSGAATSARLCETNALTSAKCSPWNP